MSPGGYLITSGSRPPRMRVVRNSLSNGASVLRGAAPTFVRSATRLVLGLAVAIFLLTAEYAGSIGSVRSSIFWVITAFAKLSGGVFGDLVMVPKSFNAI